MYKAHNPVIAKAMTSEYRYFERGCLFALLSIRQPVRNVPAMLADVLEHGSDSAYLFGWKRNAYQWLGEYGPTLWMQLVTKDLSLGRRVDLVAQCPGLGIVKAAFVLQLMGYDVACLDGRNVAREGRKLRAFRSDGPGRKQGPAWHAKIQRYLAETEGKAEVYWNDWCKDVAEAYDMTPNEVSALHLAIVPDDYVPF